jgi:O-antigen/teichoic acid export membrane protein
MPFQLDPKKEHLWGSALLFGGRVFQLVSNLGVQVLVVRYLSRSEYGALAYALATIEALALATVLGFDKVVARNVAIYRERGDFAHILGTLALAFASIASVGALLMAVVIGAGPWLFTQLQADSRQVELAPVLIALAPINAASSVLVTLHAVFSGAGVLFRLRYIVGSLFKLLAIADRQNKLRFPHRRY